jgi:hypothetical protein
MEYNQINEIIKNAIKTQSVLSIQIKDDTDKPFLIEFNPYILGQDILQYDFVWGETRRLFYKLDLDKIESVSALPKKFEVSENACYQFSLEEEHYEVLNNFDNVFGQAAVLCELTKTE